MGTKDIEQAKLKLAEYVLTKTKLEHEKPENVPLSSILKRYYNNHAINTPSYDMARLAISKISTFYPDITAGDFNKNAQRKLFDHMKSQKVSNGYIQRLFTVYKAAFNFAKDNEEITQTPSFIKIQANNARERVLTLEESARLFNAIESEHILSYCMIAFNTLARPEAILDLQPFQVDFDNRLINLNPKGREQTKKYRPVIPLTNTLNNWLGSTHGAEYYVNWQGRKIKSIKTTWRNVRDKAGLDKEVIAYTIRHTMATVLRKKGVPAWEVQGILGHKSGSLKTTEIYAKYDPDYLGRATRAIDDYFAELQPLVKHELIVKNKRLRTICVPHPTNIHSL